MMEKDKIEQFMVYGIENKISLKEVIRNEMVFLFISLILIFAESQGLGLGFFMILILLPTFFYPISCIVIVIKKGRAIEGTAYFLHNGIYTACFSFFWAVIGMAWMFSLFSGRERIVGISIFLIGYFVSLFLWFFIIKRSITKTNNKNSNKMLGGISIPICALSGISLGRIFFKGMDQDSAKKIFCCLCFFISYLCTIGLGSFIKYHYIMKHPEILDKKRS